MVTLPRWIQHLSVVSDPHAALRRVLQSGTDPVEQMEQVRRCLAQGADPNRAAAGEAPVLSLMIDQFLDQHDEHSLLARHRLAIVDALLNAGADPNTSRASDGCTPMHLAMQHGLWAVFERLTNHGGDPKVPLKNRSALHLSTDSRITAWLLDHGADPMALFEGATALEHARINAQALKAHEALHAQQRAAMGMFDPMVPSRQAERAMAVFQVMETFVLRNTLLTSCSNVPPELVRSSVRSRL